MGVKGEITLTASGLMKNQQAGERGIPCWASLTRRVPKRVVLRGVLPASSRIDDCATRLTELVTRRVSEEFRAEPRLRVEGVSFLGSGGGTWLSSLFCLIDWGS